MNTFENNIQALLSFAPGIDLLEVDEGVFKTIGIGERIYRWLTQFCSDRNPFEKCESIRVATAIQDFFQQNERKLTHAEKSQILSKLEWIKNHVHHLGKKNFLLGIYANCLDLYNYPLEKENTQSSPAGNENLHHMVRAQLLSLWGRRGTAAASVSPSAREFPMPRMSVQQYVDTEIVPSRFQYIGNAQLIAIHRRQIEDFKYWVQTHDWETFAHSHYDWWAFPVDRVSEGYGQGFAVPLQEIERLKQDPQFIKNYRLGVKLMLQSWGWDLDANAEIPAKEEGQEWRDYFVRLGKVMSSLKLFGEYELLRKVQAFAKSPAVDQNAMPDWIQDLTYLHIER